KKAVIGAGPAGLTTAYLLRKKGFTVDVYEARDQVGGLAKSTKLWNQMVDLGRHRFFTRKQKVNDLWLSLAGNDYRNVNRLTRIFYENKFFYYPLKPLNALFTLGPLAAIRCILSYLKPRVNPKKEDLVSFEDGVISR